MPKTHMFAISKNRYNQNHQAAPRTHKMDPIIPHLPANKQPMPILHHQLHFDLTHPH